MLSSGRLHFLVNRTASLILNRSNPQHCLSPAGVGSAKFPRFCRWRQEPCRHHKWGYMVISAINRRKRSGTSSEPCSTPTMIGRTDHLACSTLTLKDRCSRQDAINLTILGFAPSWLKINRPSCILHQMHFRCVGKPPLSSLFLRTQLRFAQ